MLSNARPPDTGDAGKPDSISPYQTNASFLPRHAGDSLCFEGSSREKDISQHIHRTVCLLSLLLRIQRKDRIK